MVKAFEGLLHATFPIPVVFVTVPGFFTTLGAEVEIQVADEVSAPLPPGHTDTPVVVIKLPTIKFPET